MFTWPMKNSMTRFAAFGVGVKSVGECGSGEGKRIRSVLILAALVGWL